MFEPRWLRPLLSEVKADQSTSNHDFGYRKVTLHARLRAQHALRTREGTPTLPFQVMHEVASPFDEHRNQSQGEEIANSVSHDVGLAAALAAASILIEAAARTEAALTVSVSSFVSHLFLHAFSF